MKDEISADIEIEVLETLVRHTRQIALTKDASKRIVASRWQMVFERELEKISRSKETDASGGRQAA